MTNSYRFFRNPDCAYFPCHKGADQDSFNCLFCYCPLYLVPDCGGNFAILGNGVKDCSGCLVPHRPENYDAIVKRLGEVIKERAARQLNAG